MIYYGFSEAMTSNRKENNMPITIKVTAGTNKTNTFTISPSRLDKFLTVMESMCKDMNLAVAYECSSERRGIFKAGVLIPA